jgi:predicted ATPase
MIVNFSVTNFKNISIDLQDKSIDLSMMNVFLGQNGAGKSSILQSIDFLKAFYGDGVEVYLRANHWDYVDLPNLRNTRKKIDWEIEFLIPPNSDGNFGGYYKLEISVLKRRYVNIGSEKLFYKKNLNDDYFQMIQRNGRATTLNSYDRLHKESLLFFELPSSVAVYIDRDSTLYPKYPHIVHFMHYVLGIRYASIFDVEKLREPALGYALEIGTKGERLLPFLARLQNRDEQLFEKIKEETLKMFPNITDFKIRGHGSSAAPKILEVYEGPTVFNGQQVSDGFLRVLAVVALRYAPMPPSILLFEEPENGVHPRLLERLLNTFRSMTKRKTGGGTQVILTSHSPYVIDSFRNTPEQVWLVSRKSPRSGAKFNRLDRMFPNGLPEVPLGEAWFEDRFFGA